MWGRRRRWKLKKWECEEQERSKRRQNQDEEVSTNSDTANEQRNEEAQMRTLNKSEKREEDRPLQIVIEL
jgi:hypothetical protein